MKTRYRVSWNGKIILQVYKPVCVPDFHFGDEWKWAWVDATMEDMSVSVCKT